jgi:hypothetical protein
LETILSKVYHNNYQQRLNLSSLIPSSIRSKSSSEELVEHIQQARTSWEQGLIEELTAIVTEAKRPFVMIREPGNVNPFLDNSSSSTSAIASGSSGQGQESIKFLYDSEDLMETLLSIRNPNLNPSYSSKLSLLSSIQLSLKPYDYNYLLKKFAELTYPCHQLSIDDLHAHQNGSGGVAPSSLLIPPSTAIGGERGTILPPPIPGNSAGFKFLSSRHEEAEFIIQKGSMLDAQTYLRKGCPLSLRSKLWRIACGVSPEMPSINEEQLFNRLRVECDRLDMISDELFMYDIQTILDDPRFFIFEEELKEIIFCFSRDSSVRDQLVYEIHSPWLKQMGIDFSLETAAPPCSVLPYLGFSTYFAPLCYVLRNKIMCYSVSKFFFCHIWCKLNVFSSDNGTLLHLCKTFESLLFSSNAKLFLHLVNIGLQPIKVSHFLVVLLFF